jgi:hypothetical protein
MTVLFALFQITFINGYLYNYDVPRPHSRDFMITIRIHYHVGNRITCVSFVYMSFVTIPCHESNSL